MPQLRPMHCYLPGCQIPIPLGRRISQLWYCCEDHYTKDTDRRMRDLEVAQGLRSPMRCGCCYRQIQRWRAVFACEYCSSRCHKGFGVTKRPELEKVERDVEVKYGPVSARMTRGEFAAIVLPAAGLGLYWVREDIFTGPFRPNIPTSIPGPQNVSFTRTISAWSSDVMKEWSQASPAVSAWRFDRGGLHILDTLLLSKAAQAIQGKLSYEFSLEEAGRARFVLGSDTKAQNCLLVELLSTRKSFQLRALLRNAAGVLSPKGEPLFIDRRNRSKPTVEISFSASSLNVNVNGENRDWRGLGVGAGLIGLAGRARDGFRVYQTKLDLST